MRYVRMCVCFRLFVYLFCWSLIFVFNGSLFVNAAKTKDLLCFPVVGDIGGMPRFPFQTSAQKRVAKLLAKVVRENGCKFIIGVGDNFYFNGVKNVEDPRFYWTYERTYSAPSLVIPWYMIAGNHDHLLNVSAQIAYTKVSKRWNFPDFYYTKVFDIPTTKKTVQLVMLDTTMLCYYNKKSNAPPPDHQLKWIEDTLKNSKSEYLIVAGHHPVYSSSNHGNTRCLLQHLKPLLEKYSVTAYFSGHDHNLQHIKTPQSSIHYFVSGSGNFVDQRFNNRHLLPPGSSRFEYAVNSGFDLVHVTNDGMKLQVFSVDPLNYSIPIHDVEIKPRTVLTSTPRHDDEINYMKMNDDVNKAIDKTMKDIDKISENLIINKLKNNMHDTNSKSDNSKAKPTEISTNKLVKSVTHDKNLNNKIDFMATTLTDSKVDSIQKTSSENHNHAEIDKSESKPIKLIDQSKITIDNLSDIPLSSYSNFPLSGGITSNNGQKAFNKTGNMLTDFILQRLPNNRVKEEKQNADQNVRTSTVKSLSTKVASLQETINTGVAAAQPSSLYKPTEYGGFVNYAQTPSASMFYGYTPSYYNQAPPSAGVSYGMNSPYSNFWGTNTPSFENTMGSSVYFMAPSYQANPTLAAETNLLNNGMERKTKRETKLLDDGREKNKDKLESFFSTQNVGING